MRLPPLDLDFDLDEAEESKPKEVPSQENKEMLNSDNDAPKIGLFYKLMEDLDKPDRKPYYTSKLLNKDLVSEMKSHWEKSKSSMITDVEGKKVEERIREKISFLKELEQTWQHHKLATITAEEKIRMGELELKKMLKEFNDLFKRHSK